MIKKNKNVNPLSSLDVDDMEVCAAFNISPRMAYTKDLNRAAADLMYEQNVKNMQRFEGMNENDARREAGRLRKEALSIY